MKIALTIDSDTDEPGFSEMRGGLLEAFWRGQPVNTVLTIAGIKLDVEVISANEARADGHAMLTGWLQVKR